jgi:membrane-bound lytic murein transglycosylase MltF
MERDNKSNHVAVIGAAGKMGSGITQTEPNIHAGVTYMRQTLFTFASYNAGPGRVRQLRRLADERGLDPNVWFGNVEQIASERIGRETVTAGARK